MIIPNIWKNKTCSKPPTSTVCIVLKMRALAGIALEEAQLAPHVHRSQLLVFSHQPVAEIYVAPVEQSQYSTRVAGEVFVLEDSYLDMLICYHLVI